ncbi:hypothetical protein ABT373_13270 [Streptomyces sp. NPDC000070]|uniref:hypothetical protein n=1 Tax=Streptomyces sp. NPDC000070 TaxID=3154240 RepID=UPI003324689C
MTVTVEAPVPSETSTTVGARTLLPLPNVHKLSRLQTEGAICVWCGAGLTTHTARDLGARPGPSGVQIFPRGCTTCVREHAARVYKIHVAQCGNCLRNKSCADREALRHLASEAAP